MRKKPPSGARARDAADEMPEAIGPQLATLARRPPATGDWSYEIKFK